jgi:hypothetical protein
MPLVAIKGVDVHIDYRQVKKYEKDVRGVFLVGDHCW